MRKMVYVLLLLSMNVYAWAAAKPPVSDASIKVFANTVIVSTYDFSYKNFVDRLSYTAKFFTGKGWVAFNKALNYSKLRNAVIQKQYIVTSVATAPPAIIHQGLRSGEYAWEIKMPVMVVYKNASFQQVQYLAVTLTIVYRDRPLVIEFFARKTPPVKCQSNSDDITVTPPK